MFKKLAKALVLVAALGAVVWAMRDRFVSIATSREPETPTFRTHPDAAPVEVIDGIGPVFAQRLTSAGIADVEQLATASPDSVSEAAGVSVARARTWIDKAKDH
jgi:predicted flap endonuclease-1-like 5' DNA nuclease